MRSKLSMIAENVPKVYAAGKASMVDDSKLIPTNVSGTSISLNDVSKLPHDVSCKVESLNLLQPTLPSHTYYGVTITKNADNSYTLSGTVTGTLNGLWGVELGRFYLNNAPQTYVSGGTADRSLEVSLYKNGAFQTTIKNTGGVLVLPAESYDELHVIVGAREDETLNAVIKPMVSLYGHSQYTPYISPETIKVVKYGEDESEGYQELTPNADGTVVGIKSTSPYMNIKTDTEGVILTATYNKSWGMQYEYDRIWDDVQQNGNRTYYNNYFTGRGWVSGVTYNPKYPITCTANGATSMFSNSYVTDTLVPITISGANASVFYGSSIVTIPLLIIGSGLTTMSDWFNNMTKLENITFEGEIYLSTSFAQSTKLTARSMVNIVEHLSDTASGKKLTFNSTAVNNADWSTTDYSSFDELILTKPNWTIGV